MYWDGQEKPSVEVPVGDFFGLNLGQYSLYQSAFLNCASIRALNCYFGMPFRKSARITVTNEGRPCSRRFLFQHRLPAHAVFPEQILYFHAQYRQATPNAAVAYASEDKELNLDGKSNYVFLETHGRGHLMGVTLGVLQNRDLWMGEGDDMTFIDDATSPRSGNRL